MPPVTSQVAVHMHLCDVIYILLDVGGKRFSLSDVELHHVVSVDVCGDI